MIFQPESLSRAGRSAACHTEMVKVNHLPPGGDGIRCLSMFTFPASHLFFHLLEVCLAIGRMDSYLWPTNYLQCSGTEIINFLGRGPFQVKLCLGTLKHRAGHGHGFKSPGWQSHHITDTSPSASAVPQTQTDPAVWPKNLLSSV